MDTQHWHQRYQPWKRTTEILFWVVLFGTNALFNSITEVMDARNQGLPFADWEFAVWETSSAVSHLLLVPVLVWFSRKWPPSGDDWRKTLALYLGASLVYSVLHVVLMVNQRHVAYAVMGGTYDFGFWPRELLYEYLKDSRTFLTNLLLIEFYRLLLRRLQGEAKVVREEVEEQKPSDTAPDRFLVKMLGREFLIATDRIEWAKAAGNYVNLHVGERDYPLRNTLSGLARQLPSDRFLQVHRSWIVNIENIREIEPLDTGDARVHMQDGTVIPCSRRYRQALKGELNGSLLQPENNAQ